MKKIILSLLMPLLIGAGFVGCSSSENNPIHPDIVGYGVLQEKKGAYFVEIDSVYFAVPSLVIPGLPPHTSAATRNVKPFVGKEITCFRAEQWQNPQFVLGKMEAEQIEFLFHKEPVSNWGVISALAVIFIVFLLLSFNQKAKEGKV